MSNVTFSTLTSKIAALRTALVDHIVPAATSQTREMAVTRLSEVEAIESYQERKVVMTVRLLPSTRRTFKNGMGFRERAIVLAISKNAYARQEDGLIVKDAEKGESILWAPVEMDGEILASQSISLRYGYKEKDGELQANFTEGGNITDARKGDYVIAKVVATISTKKNDANDRFLDTGFSWTEETTDEQTGEVVSKEVTMVMAWVNSITFASINDLVEIKK